MAAVLRCTVFGWAGVVLVLSSSLPTAPPQAGFVAAATALLRSASSGDSPDSGSPDTWRKILKGISAAGLASDVRRLAAALHRIATVSAAVAGPVVYAPLLAQLQQEQPERQRRRH